MVISANFGFGITFFSIPEKLKLIWFLRTMVHTCSLSFLGSSEQSSSATGHSMGRFTRRKARGWWASTIFQFRLFGQGCGPWRGGSTRRRGSVVCTESRVAHVKWVVFRCMCVRGAKQVVLVKRITWKSRDFTSIIDLERRVTEYPTLNGFDKFIHSIERFATLVPLSEKTL